LRFIDPDGREVKNKYYSDVKNFFGLKQSSNYYMVEKIFDGLKSTAEGERLFNKLHSSKIVFNVGFGSVRDEMDGYVLGLHFANVRGSADITIDYEQIKELLDSGKLSIEEWVNLAEALIQVGAHEFKHGEQLIDRSKKS